VCVCMYVCMYVYIYIYIYIYTCVCDTKNKTSETMNRIIPHRNPFVTIFVCNP